MAKDIIPGGMADNKSDKDFDPKALKKGLKVEKEHTSSTAIAKEIARDHLTEDPKYYDKLEKIEKKAFWKGFEKQAAVFKTLGQAISSAKPQAQKILSGAEHSAKIQALRAQRAATKAPQTTPGMNKFFQKGQQAAAKKVQDAGLSAHGQQQASRMATPSMFRKALES